MARERVTVNIGGKQFQTFKNTLKKWPDTLLSNLNKDSIFWDENYQEYFFDRDPNMFSVILNFYRFGEVHLPHNVCGPAMRRELEFWGIQDKIIAPCCWKSYNSYQDQERCISMIEEAFGSTSLYTPDEKSSRCEKIKAKIYAFLEEPNSSKGAKVFSWIFGLLLIVTVAITIMTSHKSFRVDTSLADDPEYANETNPKLKLYTTTKPHMFILILDYGLLCFFTGELILRFAVCPMKKRFFRSFFNIIDMIAILPKWTSFIISYAHPAYFSHSTLFNVMGYLTVGEVFRVLRILKLAKNFTGLKVLILTVRSSLQEMALLLFIVITGSMMFAVGIYFSEFNIPDTFPDMATGSYWALITMTTVGYGDMFPQTHWGRFVGILCALTGIFCTGLPIPIIANNFDLYYSYARIRKAMKDREKERELAMKQKIKTDGKRVLQVTHVITSFGRTKDETEPENKRPPFCTPRDPPTKDPLAPFTDISPKHRGIIIRALRRYRQRKNFKKKPMMTSRDSRESRESLAISIPSTDTTDISSRGSASPKSHHSTIYESSISSTRIDVTHNASVRRGSKGLRRVQVSPSAGDVMRRSNIARDIEDIDLM